MAVGVAVRVAAGVAVGVVIRVVTRMAVRVAVEVTHCSVSDMLLRCVCIALILFPQTCMPSSRAG